MITGDNLDNLTKRLRNKIEIISKNKVIDEDGYPLEKEISIRKCYASIRGLRGREFFSSSQVQSEKYKVFNLRFFKGLNERMYIKYNDKLYNIKSINDLNERHIEYEIYATEVSSSE